MVKEPADVRLGRSPLHLLHRALQRATDVFQVELGDDGLTPRQYVVLLTVSLNKGLSQTQLVELTGIDRSTVAGVVRRMTDKGLLQRRRTRDDARAYAVSLTGEGAKLLKTYDPMVRRVDERILASLPSRQRDGFLQELTTIVQTLNRVEKTEAPS
jgi:DNA-binding MarR family transcriptional regulator